MPVSDTDNIEITKKKLMLAEGKDADHFMRHSCPVFRGDEEVQVLDFGGINELTDFLNVVVDRPEFENVESLVIARDAETNSGEAFQSIQGSINLVNSKVSITIPVPEKPFEFITSPDGAFKCAAMIFPGPDIERGTLEDLCLATVQDDPILECVDTYLDCVREKGEDLPHSFKNKLYTYLAGRDKSVGKSIGLAFTAKVWNQDHAALEPFKNIIQAM